MICPLMPNTRILRFKRWKCMKHQIQGLCHSTQHEAVTLCPGSKKDTSSTLPKKYDAEFVQSCWYEWWCKQGYFSPGHKARCGQSFVVCLPPPNVTGTLHLGHALGGSIQDAIVRWRRMSGDDALWVPGTDHAGVATQVVVEKQLSRDLGVTRHDIGRQQFIDHVWRWKHEKGGAICDQMKKLGLSLAWDWETFTLDPKLSEAVREAFIRLHDEDLIYRSQKLVNWCCQLKSTISDIEVDGVELAGRTYLAVPGYDEKIPFGVMTSVRYPVENLKECIAVATTRPETMLGDVAIAVHPDDPRYSHLHGRRVIHPLTGLPIPIICDQFVDREFGSGAVKITPAHDPKDFEVGIRHNLPLVNILSDEGALINVPDAFQGLPRFEARERVVDVLRDKQLLGDVCDHAMVLPLCSRTGDVVEYLLKDQWFLNCDDMARQASQAVKCGELKLVPDFYEKQWHDWLDTIRDWCVSRQLWWGHQIPAYKVTEKQGGKELGWVSAHSEREALTKAGRNFSVLEDDISLEQDSDVLDTWFSSALLPFSVFGWPHETGDLAAFFPTDLLVTASDIMFFWVARMVMMSQKLTGKLPFNTVLLHSVLRDSSGRKMSKSLGNIIDPMDVINGITLQGLREKLTGSYLSEEEVARAWAAQSQELPDGIPACGVDALRYTLCSYNYKANFIDVSVDQVIQNYRFCNKIWQSFMFITSQLPADFTVQPIQVSQLTDTDRWLLSRLSTLVHDCHIGFSNYDLYKVTAVLKSFWWDDVCDVYLEYVKVVKRSGDVGEVFQLLQYTLITYLRCLAPFMPYLCEELYQRLPAGDRLDSICVDAYPHPDKFPWMDEAMEADVIKLRMAVTDVRSLTSQMSKFKLNIRCADPDVANIFEKYKILLKTFCRFSQVTFSDQTPEGCLTHYGEGYTLHAQPQASMDQSQELARVEAQIKKLHKSLEKLARRTDSKSGVPQHIVTAAQSKVDGINEKLAKLKERQNILQQNNIS